MKVGSPETLAQNNAFFCLILCTISFLFQLKSKPFLTDELNDLNEKSSLTLIVTIFLGFFISFCQNFNLELILVICLFIFNSWFILITAKKYIQLKIALSKKSKFLSFLKKTLPKFWSKG